MSLAANFIAFPLVLLASGYSLGEEIRESQNSRSAVIGGAYDSRKEAFIGSQCVHGETIPTGASESTLSLDQSLSNDQVARELGLSVGTRARYGVYRGSIASNFLSSSMSTDFSVASTYSARYSFKRDKLAVPRLNRIGDSVSANYERWLETCGTHYVDEVRTGGRFYFSIRVDFSSREEKNRFEASFRISGPAAGVNATLRDASRHFSGRTKVTVAVYQYGGDVSQVSGIFASTENGRRAYIQCSLGNFEDCAKVIANALRYATDVKSGFPSQLGVHGNRAVLSYNVTSYTAAGIYHAPPPLLDHLVQLKRDELAKKFEEQFAMRQMVSAILNTDPGQPRQRRLVEAGELLDRNLSAMVAASTVCYEAPANCPSAVDGLSLAEINERVFRLPMFYEMCQEAYLGSDPARRDTIAALLLDSGESRNSNRIVPRACCDPRAEEGPMSCLIERRPDYVIVSSPISRLGSRIDLGRRRLYKDFDFSRKLRDLTPLQTADGITWLDVSGHAIERIDVLALQPELEFVYLSDNRISDLRPLGIAQRLRVLNASKNQIADLGPLSGLKELKELSLSHNLIGNLADFKDAPRLVSLELSHNQITDISPLSALPELQILDVRHNLIRSLGSFQPARLKQLLIEENQIPFSEIEEFCKRAPANLRITFTAEDGHLRAVKCARRREPPN